MTLRQPCVLLSAAVALLSGVALAQKPAPKPIHDHELAYTAIPNVPGAMGAQIVGDPQQSGPYTLRVKLDKGALIPPHTHPDTRNSTVLSGTIYVGFGTTFDANDVVAIPQGSVYVAPAGVPHYIWAKDGPAVYQESGSGPSGNVFIAQ